MLVGDSKKPAELRDLRENHTETTVSFTIVADKEKLDEFEASKGGLLAKFKLSTSLTTSNMTLFDLNGRIERFDTPLAIMEAFYAVRLEYYSKRKDNLIRNLEAEKLMLSNKARFVEEVCSGLLVVSNRKRKELLTELKTRGYDLIAKETKKGSDDNESSDNEEETEDAPSVTELAKGYEYLLGMKIWSLTYEKAEQLREQLALKVAELQELQATSPSQIWLKDLAAIETALNERDIAYQNAAANEQRAQKKNQTRQTKIAKAAKKSKDVVVMHDSDDEFMGHANERKRVAEKKPISKATLDLIDQVDEVLSSQLQSNLVVSPPSKKRLYDGSNEVTITALAEKNCAPITKETKKAVLKPNTSTAATNLVKPKPKKITNHTENIEHSETVKVKKAVEKKSKKPVKKQSKTFVGSDDDDESDDFAELVEKKTKKRVKKQNKTFIDSDDEDESDDFEFKEENLNAPPPSRAKRTVRAAANKPKSAPVYSFSDDDDSSF